MFGMIAACFAVFGSIVWGSLKVIGWLFTWPFRLFLFSPGEYHYVDEDERPARYDPNDPEELFRTQIVMWPRRKGYHDVKRRRFPYVVATEENGAVWVFRCDESLSSSTEKPVLMAASARQNYHAKKAAVVSNVGFTEKARMAAAREHVKLIILRT